MYTYMYTWKQYIDVYTNKLAYVTVCVCVIERGCVSVYVESVCECVCGECVCVCECVCGECV